ncbi:MAG: hypothetical protein WDZ37_01790 [Solirubrobacterales bacterium]
MMVPDERLEGVEAGSTQETSEADEVTAEFVSGMEQPSSSANGYGTPDEPTLPDNPEIVVGAAFLGGFLLGRLVRRFGS